MEHEDNNEEVRTARFEKQPHGLSTERSIFTQTTSYAPAHSFSEPKVLLNFTRDPLLPRKHEKHVVNIQEEKDIERTTFLKD